MSSHVLLSPHIYDPFVSFYHDTAPPEIYTLSLHDALPISSRRLDRPRRVREPHDYPNRPCGEGLGPRRSIRVIVDRKSTRLNSSHANISYAVFCLKKKKTTQNY